MKSVSNKSEVTIKKVDNDNYKVFYNGILLEELTVHPVNDFHFIINQANLVLAQVSRTALHKFEFITGEQRFHVYIQLLFKAS